MIDDGLWEHYGTLATTTNNSEYVCQTMCHSESTAVTSIGHKTSQDYVLHRLAIVLPDLPGNQCRTCAWYALVFPSIEVVPWPEWPSCYSVLRPPPWSESWEQLSLDDSSTFHEKIWTNIYRYELIWTRRRTHNWVHLSALHLSFHSARFHFQGQYIQYVYNTYIFIYTSYIYIHK